MEQSHFSASVAQRVRRIFTSAVISVLAAIAAFATATPEAFAQGAAGQGNAWPSKPIRFIVPFATGGPTDGASRLIAQRLEKVLGQPVLVENITGQGGGIGAGRIAKAEPDGYTIGLVHVGTQAINPFIYAKLSYDPLKEFQNIARIYEYTNVLVVNAEKPYKTLPDLIKVGKDNPATIPYGSAGIGSSNHLSGELLSARSGAKFRHVPYRGSGPAITDLIGGRLDFMFDVLLTSQPHIDSGKLRVIAVTSAKRMAQLPDVPAIAETIPGFDVVGWVGITAPKGVPQPIVARLTQEIEKILKEPETLARFKAWGFETRYGTPDDMQKDVERDLALWGPIVKESGAKLDE